MRDYQQENAKAEQTGAAIAILWFIAFFIGLPLVILFPPLIVPIIAGVIWVFYRLNQTKTKK